jgi:predicted nucleic acid-binding protein
VLIYSLGTHEESEAKRALAIELLDRDGGALSVQVLQEFYVQATRATRAKPLTHGDALDLIGAWRRFVTQDLTYSVLQSALQIRDRYEFSYWDSSIVAAARELGCRTLYTEDLSHGQWVEGVQIIDPFR